MKNIFHTPLFWSLFILTSIGSVAFSVKYFSQAIPLLSVDIDMSRTDALSKAQKLAKQFNWGPQEFRQAATFAGDQQTQTYVELEAGGKKAFIDMIDGTLYSPYKWQVRHFKPHEPNQTFIRFTPEGNPYGFVEVISENTPGPDLNTHQARNIAEKHASSDWSINLQEYKLIESSKEVRPSKRADHVFVYERPDIKIGKGLYRLKLVVSGDKFTELTHFVKVPENFLLRYQEMRSDNNSIAFGASMLMYLLYLLGGCILGLFFLARKNWILWRTAALWGFSISFVLLLNGFNQLPLAWMHYDTAISAYGFLLNFSFGQALGFLINFIQIAVCAAAAESLTRKAFGQHPRFWDLWKQPTSSSFVLLGRTIGAYLIVPIFLAFVVLFNLIVTHYFGWWMPSAPQTDPNILATYAPWLQSIAISLKAGFWEECLFRAVPLAGAALLGTYFGCRRIAIAIMFVVQALIFGAAHANYPNLPSYARVIELILPSFMFGAVYLRFGLLPGIITHVLYDVFWFALPIFLSSAAGVLPNQIAVILLSLVPMLVVLCARIKSGSWQQLTNDYLNLSWKPIAQAATIQEPPAPQTIYKVPNRTQAFLYTGAVLGIIFWLLCTQLVNDAPALTISRTQAIEHAKKELASRNITLSDEWQPLTQVSSAITLAERFVWQNGKKQYTQLNDAYYLNRPLWIVRFARFTGSVDERKEEYRVFVSDKGTTMRFIHTLPESAPGALLEEQDARMIAHSGLQNLYNLSPQEVKELSAKATKREARKDWLFTFENKAIYPLETGDARIDITISGDTITDSSRYVHVPEDWERNEKDRKNVTGLLQSLCGMLISAIVMLGIGFALSKWAIHLFHVRSFLYTFGMLVIIRVIQLINGWPSMLAFFNTTEPYAHQLFRMISSFGIGTILIASLSSALVVGLLHSYRKQSFIKNNTKQTFSLGALLGGLIIGLLSLVQYFRPSMAPLWADYLPLGNYVPTVGIILNFAVSYLMLTSVFYLLFTGIDTITHNGKRNILLSIFAFTIFGVALSGTPSFGGAEIESILYWLVSGAFYGLTLWLSYHFMIRHDLALVPVVTLVLINSTMAQQLFFNAYPAVFFGIPLASTVIGIAVWYWFNALRVIEKTPPQPEDLAKSDTQKLD